MVTLAGNCWCRGPLRVLARSFARPGRATTAAYAPSKILRTHQRIRGEPGRHARQQEVTVGPNRRSLVRWVRCSRTTFPASAEIFLSERELRCVFRRYKGPALHRSQSLGANERPCSWLRCTRSVTKTSAIEKLPQNPGGPDGCATASKW